MPISSGSPAWRTTPAAARAFSDAAIIDTLRGLRTGSASGGALPETLYGRRKMTAWLDHSGFPGVSKHTVDRLMREEGMRGLVRGRKVRTTIAGKDGGRAGDLLNRDFATTAPNRAWVTDFTYVPTWSGVAYVAFAIDLSTPGDRRLVRRNHQRRRVRRVVSVDGAVAA